ncbi:hypothetical protein [Microbulbifer elongatus]|uniref:hypothetical protein n=1 Tax=Microbulbifer elongatus TaxID=86173 RepID=UPI001CFD5D78|nr:hypothetical protein [Microbulbifer elongatus]
MAGLLRLGPAGISQHVIQRGNNRQVCFFSEQDLIVFAGWLKQVDLNPFIIHFQSAFAKSLSNTNPSNKRGQINIMTPIITHSNKKDTH